MAKKVEEKKQSKVLEVLTTEYKAEGIILAVLGLVVIVTGAYVLQNTIVTFNDSIFGILDEQWKINVFAWFVIALGAAAFIISVWPFFVPSIGEMKKVSWPDRDTLLNHTARVFGFIIFLALFFLALELGLKPLFELIKG